MLALHERDRHLDHGEPVQHRVPQHVDLEAVPARVHLLEMQRAAGRVGGVVLEGRDIGSVVFPQAEVKVFLTASVIEVRPN